MWHNTGKCLGGILFIWENIPEGPEIRRVGWAAGEDIPSWTGRGERGGSYRRGIHPDYEVDYIDFPSRCITETVLRECGH